MKSQYRIKKCVHFENVFFVSHLLLNLRSPRDYVGSFAPVVYVLDKETPRTADVTVTKIAGYVPVRILMNR